MASIYDWIEFSYNSSSAICPLPQPLDFAYLGYPLPFYQQFFAMWPFLTHTEQKYISFLPFCISKIISAWLPAPLVVTNELSGLKKKRSFINKVEKGFLSFLTFSFSMLKHASMFEYSPSPLGCSLRIFEAWGSAIHCLKYYLSQKFLFKQEFSFDVCDIRALIQCNFEPFYILIHIRIDLMGI